MAKSTLPTTMRAWNFSTSGAPNQILSLNPAHPAPSPPTGSKLLVKVSYVGLTSAGINLMRDVPSILRKNAIPEGDFSGHVALAGPSAGPEFSAGTRVFGTIHPTAGLLSGAGTLAEYLLVPSELVQVVPSNVRLKEATALGGLAQTALKMVETAVVANGHRVLVHGASGGVGIVALQLAKARGAIVVATCSKRNFELVQAAGADEVSHTTCCEFMPRYLKMLTLRRLSTMRRIIRCTASLKRNMENALSIAYWTQSDRKIYMFNAQHISNRKASTSMLGLWRTKVYGNL